MCLKNFEFISQLTWTRMKQFMFMCPQMMQESVSLFMFVLQMKQKDDDLEARE
jgi:hypothetical protein